MRWLEDPAGTRASTSTRISPCREGAPAQGLNASNPLSRPPASQARCDRISGNAWVVLVFCASAGFGGCLADEMGLGKTVMVLALLESRRLERRIARVALLLVVVPRSFISIGSSKRARFAPSLRMADYPAAPVAERATPARIRHRPHDVWNAPIRDVLWLKDIEFDYAILDEAQAIKNAGTTTAEGGAAADSALSPRAEPARPSRTTSASSGACSSS